jgi:serine/threonine protein kinase
MSNKELLFARAEVENLLSMDHPNIVRVLDVYESRHQLHVVMECMEGVDLYDKLTAKKKFSEEEASEALRHMLLALNYMHANGIVHRDVKLENFMFDVRVA